MAKDFNTIAAYAIKENGISQKILMEKFGLNRFSANNMLSQLQDAGVISGHFPTNPLTVSEDICPPIVKMCECEYLGIDVDKFDFKNMDIRLEKETEISKRITPEMYAGIDADTCKFFAVDGNEARLRCGDAITGDSILMTQNHETGINRDGDSIGYVTGYEYHFNESVTMKVTGHSYDIHQFGWKTNEAQQGWGVRAVGIPNTHDTVRKDAQHPAKFLNAVLPAPLGRPVTNMDYTYADFQHLKEIKSIPETVTSIHGMCYECMDLTKTPYLPEGIIEATCAFCQCNNLGYIENIPSTIANAKDMFYACSYLDAGELSKIPDNLNKSEIARFCGERCCADGGVLGNKPITTKVDEKSVQTNDTKDTQNHNTDDIDL